MVTTILMLLVVLSQIALDKNRILIDLSASSAQLRLVSPDTLAAWERLDRRFMAYPDNLTDLLYAWVKAHPKDFGQIP